MVDIFVTSDTHLHHANILTFLNADGSRLRPFSTVEEMDETIIERWNKVVKPQDHVYHLGDVAMSKKWISLIGRCNGKKRLVRGNHDIHDDKFYREFFEKMYGVRVFENQHLILSHIPLHPECLKQRTWYNIHGHVHGNPNTFGPNYVNVCVEVTDYTPVALEDIRMRLAAA